MIQAVTTPQQQAEYRRRIASKPYFESVLGTHLALFGAHPASGWMFYLLPGTAVLELRGGSGALCGGLPDDEDTREELQGFLRFLHVDCLRCEHPLPAAYANTWQSGKPLTLWTLPQGHALPPPKPPAEEWGLTLDTAPSMLPISRLVFAESDAEADEFYSTACTALAHGYGTCRALLYNGKPVCTVGCYEQCAREAYMAAGVTAPEWRGRGLAGWLIASLANELAAEKDVCFLCLPHLREFYQRLGFVQNGMIQQYTTDWNTK